MTAFAKTWEGTVATDFVGKRGLDAIETNLALMQLNGKVDNAYYGIAQNWMIQSAAFDNAAWSKSNVTISANTSDTTDPLGGNTADKMTETTTANVEHLFSQIMSQGGRRIQVGLTYTSSCYIKQGTTRYAIIRTGASMFALEGYVIDMQTGIGTAIGAFDMSRAEIVNAGNGWWRVALTATATATNNANSPFGITMSNTPTPSVPNITYTGSTSNSMYVWGAQFELKTRMGPYTATTTTVVSGGNADWCNTVTTTTRAANTTFTNSTGRNMLIMVSVNLLSTATALAAGGVPTANMQVKETTDGALFTVSNISVPAAPLLGLANTDEIYQVYGIVGPGGTYRCNTTAPANSTATITNWYEFTFDANHTPNTWTQSEYVSDVRKLNKYAGAVSALLDKTGSLTRTSSNAANTGTATTTIIPSMRFNALKCSDTTAIAAGIFDSDRSVTIGQSKVASTTTATTIAFFSNPYGGHSFPATVAPLNTCVHDFFTFGTLTDYSFASGDTGSAVETKFKAMDQQASVGMNTTNTFSRVNHGTGTGTWTRTGSWYLSIVNVTFTPTITAAATCEINQTGLVATGQAYGEVPTALTPRAGLIMSFLVVCPSGVANTITQAECTVGTKYSWMPSGTITQTFAATGAEQTWVVPTGVTSIQVDMAGAQGGDTNSGVNGTPPLGGRIQATVTVTPGETLRIGVGVKGVSATAGVNGTGGFYQAGNGNDNGINYGGGGGGMSYLKRGGAADSNRILVAAGAGGVGGTTGTTGANYQGGQTLDTEATASSAATNGAASTNAGGGGGGWRGGAGGNNGGGGNDRHGRGGTNMRHSTQTSSVTSTAAYQTGDGYVYISYTPP